MKKAGVWAGVILLVYAVTIFYQSLSLDYSTRLGPGPGFFPLWLSGILTVLALVYIFEAFKKDTVLLSDILPGGQAGKSILATLAGLILFPAVVSILGFVISSAMLLFIMFVRDYKWYTALGISVGLSLVLLVVFQSPLGVSLPVNDYGW